MLGFLAEQSFSTLFLAAPANSWIVHAPIAVISPDRLRFHVARRNSAAGAGDGTRIAFSCLGPHAYVSPDWYGSEDQVPTWNYVEVEGEGLLRRLDEEELVNLLDQLSAVQESQLAPKPAWTRDKMSSERFDAMLHAITGFEIELTALRGTRKLGQNKSTGERVGAVAGLRASGNAEMAALMEKET